VSRVAVALFWFNPLVWLLAREAHQLREEAADDAVLAADIEDTDYAKLLVGVARHECRGLLIGAHGVAPGRNSLSRRIKRVLDTATARAPGGWRWASAAGFFAAGMAVPVAALNLVAPGSATLSTSKKELASVAAPNETAALPAVATGTAAALIPDIVASTTSTALSAAIAATKNVEEIAGGHAGQVVSRAIAPSGASVTTMADGMTIARAPGGATVTVYPPDQKGRRRIVSRAPNGAVAETFSDDDHKPHARVKSKADSEIDLAIAMRAVGVTREYAAALQAAAPHLGRLSADDLIELKAVGVTGDYVHELARAGLRGLPKDDLVEARAVGIRGEYVRDLAAAGYSGLTLDQLVELRAVGVTGGYIERLKRAGYGRFSVDKLVEMKAVGVDPDDLRRDGG
ncbi:MAG TPA: M56 family metallopeptidase, partial [Sphingomicrobium sp.]|nr:M56 family metallopeptidase [Sphingomicrobium sp.]